MNRLQYIVIHAMGTPRRRWVSRGDLEAWHMGPLDLQDGAVRFKGKVYESREALPMAKINGVWIKYLHGRGWDRLGYADIIHHTGEIENVTPYNDDDFVDAEEITWGAVGVNSVSRHVALEGGIHPVQGTDQGIWKFEALYTYEQFVYLSAYLKQAILDHPDIEIIGHNSTRRTVKTCPNFIVQDFCEDIGIEKKNIGLIV